MFVKFEAKYHWNFSNQNKTSQAFDLCIKAISNWQHQTETTALLKLQQNSIWQ